MDSLWTKTAVLPSKPMLSGDLRTDVLIIGGGIAGILCAYQLEQAGVDYALVEASTICSGITGCTTAKITSQHGLIYRQLIQKFGLEQASRYLRANEQALDTYRQLCREIDCDFQEQDAFVYSLDSKKKLLEELAALKQLGYPAEWQSETSLPLPVVGAVKFPKQAQFHPLKFVAAIAENLKIYEHTRVTELKPGQAVTPNGNIYTKKMIVATHFPFLNKHGSYFLKQYQHRSYVIALENVQNVNGMYVDEVKNGLTFRNADGLLLITGGSHRTGRKGGGWAELREFAKRHYPNSTEVSHWATQDCMTLDQVPYIGQYSKRTPDLFVATGFNKWGMTSAMVASTLLRDLVLGKDNPLQETFSPSRSIVHSQLAINGLEAVANLITPTAPRCPHLGCALKWNPQERSWDCPCHGSRFSEEGKLIDNPATGDLPKDPRKK